MGSRALAGLAIGIFTLGCSDTHRARPVVYEDGGAGLDGGRSTADADGPADAAAGPDAAPCAAGECACPPGLERPCYTGPPGTEGVGPCAAGVETCRPDGSGFAPCRGQVLPRAEVCDDVEDDCDGALDEGDDCAVHASCRAVGDARRCVCDAGFEGDGLVCVDIDECAASPCRNGGVCANHDGGFRCDCAGIGYRGPTCEREIDECAEGLDGCRAPARCENTPGGYTCACEEGLFADGRGCCRPEDVRRFYGPSKRIIARDGHHPEGIAAADLDGDGDPDVLTVWRVGREVGWYPNQGDGTFGPWQVAVHLGAIHQRPSLLTPDLDGDGDLDIVIVPYRHDEFLNVLAWSPNNGDGTFGRPRTIVTGAPRYDWPVTLADLDGDGDLDVACGSVNDDAIIWYPNHGDGTFGPRLPVVPSTARTSAVAAPDLDADGDLDILYSDVNGVMWAPNDGDGTFGERRSIFERRCCSSERVAAADLHGDGDLDVVTYSRSGASWFPNNGNAGFDPRRRLLDGTRADPMSLTDIDGDGDPDFLLMADHGLRWLPNRGDGSLGTPQTLARFSSSLFGATTTDLDGDGDNDLVSASKVEDEVAWYPNEGGGTFGGQTVISRLAESPTAVLAADLDGDGDLDALSASSGAVDEIAWHPNRGDGTFGEQRVISHRADGVSAVFAADLEGDGDLDVLSASTDDDEIAWYPNDGQGAFAEKDVVSTLADHPRAVHAADLDGDDDHDVLSVSLVDGKVAWYPNQGDGTFGEQRVIDRDSRNTKSVLAADLDGDGDLDVLSAGVGIEWYANRGDGTFGQGRSIEDFHSVSRAVTVADLDGDGDPDVLASSWSGHALEWYVNDGEGTFGEPRLVFAFNGSGPTMIRAVFVSDLDDDGDPDALSASHGEIGWHPNDGGGRFGERRVITDLAHGLQSLFAADLDGDGDPDVLTASAAPRGDNVLAWYRNELVCPRHP